jgi:hypothetical protein
MAEHLDRALGVNQSEAPLSRQERRWQAFARKAGGIVLAAALTIGAGVAINQRIGEDRIFNLDRSNPADTDHTYETVVTPDGRTIIIENSNASQTPSESSGER